MRFKLIKESLTSFQENNTKYSYLRLLKLIQVKKALAVECLFCDHLGKEQRYGEAMRQQTQKNIAWQAFSPEFDKSRI